jgi:hypothetical protein
VLESYKTCFKCKRRKPLRLFYKHPMMADGHLGKCKACAKKDVKANREKKRSYYSEYDRLRHQRPERKAAVQARAKKYRERYPGKARARTIVSNAVRDGRLQRQPCEICGDVKSQAHHDDYRKPLQVRWLCFVHHREHGHGQTVTVKTR